MNPIVRMTGWILVASLLGCLSGRAQQAPDAKAADASRDVRSGRFGFSGLEIFKVDAAATLLRAADIDGDGLTDLAVVNNARATIEFFIQKTADEIAQSRAKPLEYDNINEIPSDARFRKESYLTEKRVFDLLLRDLNGDKRPDLVYYGDPRELVVVTRTKDGWAAAPRRFPVAGGRPSGRLLTAGDLNGDGRTDLALLGLEKIYLYYQRKDGTLAEPAEMPLSGKDFTVIEAVDADGDGREDLLLAGAGQVEPLRLRLQGAAGLGPEIALETAALRSLLVGDVTGAGRPEISVVQASTGRIVTFRLESARTGEVVPLGRVRLFPLRGGQDVGRQSVNLADIDGDGKIDVLVTYPALAQFHLHRQGPDGNLQAPGVYPALAAATGASVGDLDGDGRLEVVVLSPEERAVGVTRWDGARLVFPASLPLKGKPGCAAVADLDGRKGDEVVVAVEEVKDRAKTLRLFAAGKPLAPRGDPIRLEGAKDLPSRIACADANQDGRPDLLLFFPYEAPRVYLNAGPAEEGGIPRFEDVSGGKDFGRGLLQGVAVSSLAGGDIDGDGKAELLLAKKAFARAVRVTDARTLEVVDQFNARDPGADLAGTACADFTGDGRPEVLLLDRARGRVWILGREEAKGPWTVQREIGLPSIRARGLETADMNGDGRIDLVVVAEDRFGVLYAGGSDFHLKRVAQYEPELKDVRLDLIERGDLDGDGRPDLVVTELRKHLLEILTAAPGRESLARGVRFKMFESKSHDGGDRRAGREPRDIVVADVTGDGKEDVILLVHDRILIYPQD